MLKSIVVGLVALAVAIFFANQYLAEKDITKEEMASGIPNYKTASSIYDFTVRDTFDKEVSLEEYKGHVLLVVNVAANCGLTKTNYAQLGQLKEKYYDKGLRILAFPCNQFASQMPIGDGEEMMCHVREANADFGDFFKKINVNGDEAAPVYKYLKNKLPGTFGNLIKWNFTKFLIDKNGQPLERFSPTSDPLSLTQNIESLL